MHEQNLTMNSYMKYANYILTDKDFKQGKISGAGYGETPLDTCLDSFQEDKNILC